MVLLSEIYSRWRSFFLDTVLRRSKPWALRWSTASSTNKWAFSIRAILLLPLLPACRGGEGEGRSSGCADGVTRRWCVPSSPACGCGVGDSVMELHGRLLTWKMLWFVSRPSRFFRCLRSGCILRSLLSAILGGEGEEGVVDAAAVWTRFRRSSGSATSIVASKRRRCVAAAIFGQGIGPAVLDQLARA